MIAKEARNVSQKTVRSDTIRLDQTFDGNRLNHKALLFGKLSFSYNPGHKSEAFLLRREEINFNLKLNIN